MKYEDVSHCYRSKEIIQDFLKEFGIDLSYKRVWRAQEVIHSMTRGFLKESYALLARHKEALKIANLGTHCDFEVDLDDHFRYVYMACRASIKGFLNCIR